MLLQAAAALVATFVASTQEAIRAATRGFTAVALIAAHRAAHDATSRHAALAAALARRLNDEEASRLRAQDPLTHAQLPATPPVAAAAEVTAVDVRDAAAAALAAHVRLQAAALQHADSDGCRSLRQWHGVGYLLVWESLLSTAGNELGMLDDFWFAAAALPVFRCALLCLLSHERRGTM